VDEQLVPSLGQHVHPRRPVKTWYPPRGSVAAYAPDAKLAVDGKPRRPSSI
jgi:hypothetical protein